MRRKSGRHSLIKASSSVAIWSKLPGELLELIIKHLDDRIRFSLVCRSLKSLSASLLPPKLNPWLIIPPEYMDFDDYISYDTTCPETLGFFSLCDGNVYMVETPELEDRRIIGSCRGGWLITVHENGEIQVYHPFSKSVMNLPPVSELPRIEAVMNERHEIEHYNVPNDGAECHVWVRNYFIHKAIMSSASPTTGVVMAIQSYLGELVFCRPGTDHTWHSLNGYHKRRFTDITFYQGHFYAVGMNGDVFKVCGLDGPSPFIELVISKPSNKGCFDKNYLVESFGDLLIVTRFQDIDYVYDEGDFGQLEPPDTNFRVIKLDISCPKWIEIDELGKDCALFVGQNHSFSLSTSDFHGIKGNCIYFTDDFFEECQEPVFGGHDHGVFNVKDRTVERCFRTCSMLVNPLPVWFTTNS